MKKKILFLMAILMFLLAGCSKNADEYIPENQVTDESTLYIEKQIYQETGCHVTGAKDITYLDKLFTTPDGQKYLYGSKNDKFWFSKYNKEGNLLWESTDPYHVASKDNASDDDYPSPDINTRAVNAILLSNGNIVVGYSEEERRSVFKRILPVIFSASTGKAILPAITENNKITPFTKKGYLYNKVSVFDDFFLCTSIIHEDMTNIPNAYQWSLLIKNDGRIVFSQESIDLISSVSLDASLISLSINENYTLKASTVPEGFETESLLWESSDEKVATVKEGVVTARSKGECIITAYSMYDKDIKAECTVKVTDQFIKFDKSTIKMLVDDRVEIGYTKQPETLEIKWESSDEKVVTVADGIVHAIAQGEADITARSADGEVEAVCHVSVGGITSMIRLSLASSGIYLDGYFSGNFQSSVNNQSNKDILLTRFEIIDSKTNKIVTYTEDADKLGILHPNSSKSIGYRISGVYLPILKWYFTYNGKEYQLSHNLQP